MVIDNISLITDTQDGVLELSAPTSSIGKTYTMNIVVSDGNPARFDPSAADRERGGGSDASAALSVAGFRCSHGQRPVGELEPVGLCSAATRGCLQRLSPTAAIRSTKALRLSHEFKATTGQTTIPAASQFRRPDRGVGGRGQYDRRSEHRRELRQPVCSGFCHAHRARASVLATPTVAWLAEQRQGQHGAPVRRHRGVSRGDGEAVLPTETWSAGHRRQPPPAATIRQASRSPRTPA